MATQEEKQAYLDQMVRERGYVLDYHKALAAADFDALRATNDLIDVVYLRARRLDRKTKELIFIHGLPVKATSRATSVSRWI
jgi:4-carboxymuconolactone decarboxylase